MNQNKIVTLFATLSLCVGIAGADEFVNCTAQTEQGNKYPIAWLNLTSSNLPKKDRQKTAPSVVLSHSIVFAPNNPTDDETELLPPGALHDFDTSTLSAGAKDGLTTKISLTNSTGDGVISLTRLRNFSMGTIVWKTNGSFRDQDFATTANCVETRKDFFTKRDIATYQTTIDNANKIWN